MIIGKSSSTRVPYNSRTRLLPSEFAAIIGREDATRSLELEYREKLSGSLPLLVATNQVPMNKALECDIANWKIQHCQEYPIFSSNRSARHPIIGKSLFEHASYESNDMLRIVVLQCQCALGQGLGYSSCVRRCCGCGGSCFGWSKFARSNNEE